MFPAQLPLTVVVNDSDLCYMLPLEVCGWFLGKMGVSRGDWVLISTNDSFASLGANLVIRGPVGINVVVGMTHLQHNPVSFVYFRCPLMCGSISRTLLTHPLLCSSML